MQKYGIKKYMRGKLNNRECSLDAKNVDATNSKMPCFYGVIERGKFIGPFLLYHKRA